VQIIAFTATADAATRADIVGRLFGQEPKIFVHDSTGPTCASP